MPDNTGNNRKGLLELLFREWKAAKFAAIDTGSGRHLLGRNGGGLILDFDLLHDLIQLQGDVFNLRFGAMQYDALIERRESLQNCLKRVASGGQFVEAISAIGVRRGGKNFRSGY